MPSSKKKITPPYERETVIRWDDEKEIVYIWTNSPKSLRHLAKLGMVVDKVGKCSTPLKEFRWRLRKKRAAGGTSPPHPRRMDKGAVKSTESANPNVVDA